LQRILIKLERSASPTKAKELMQSSINHLLSYQPWRYVVIAADVDPM
ncbi:MAG: hypothetical protein GXY94_00570, partial [Bacteroidales bacterium]|nr:hypothetical protein [Bacteroidales bacterium]